MAKKTGKNSASTAAESCENDRTDTSIAGSCGDLKRRMKDVSGCY